MLLLKMSQFGVSFKRNPYRFPMPLYQKGYLSLAAGGFGKENVFLWAGRFTDPAIYMPGSANSCLKRNPYRFPVIQERWFRKPYRVPVKPSLKLTSFSVPNPYRFPAFPQTHAFVALPSRHPLESMIIAGRCSISKERNHHRIRTATNYGSTFQTKPPSFSR